MSRRIMLLGSASHAPFWVLLGVAISGACSSQQTRATVAELAPAVCRAGLLDRGVNEGDVDRICSNAPALTQLGADIVLAVERARASGGAGQIASGLGGEGGGP